MPPLSSLARESTGSLRPECRQSGLSYPHTSERGPDRPNHREACLRSSAHTSCRTSGLSRQTFAWRFLSDPRRAVQTAVAGVQEAAPVADLAMEPAWGTAPDLASGIGPMPKVV